MVCELSTASTAITECALPHQPVFLMNCILLRMRSFQGAEIEFNEDQTVLQRQSLNVTQHSSEIITAISIQFCHITGVFSREIYHYHKKIMIQLKKNRFEDWIYLWLEIPTAIWYKWGTGLPQHLHSQKALLLKNSQSSGEGIVN